MRYYILHFLSIVTLILAPALIFSWWAEPIHGDLTRIGKLTENYFGPNKKQPTIQVKENDLSMTNPDVLVLGDSFSARNLWQSIFSTNTNLLVQSFHYEKNCISNWLQSAIADSTSKIIVMQTVERAFVARFLHVSSCPKRKPIPIKVNAGIEESSRAVWPPTLNFTYLIPTAINTVQSNFSDEKYSKKFQVVKTSISVDCALFSNRHNNEFIYYIDDDSKQKWNKNEINNSIENILKIQKEIEEHGKKFIFIIAPDKSSAYQNCLQNNSHIDNRIDITQLLINAGVNTPNLQIIFKNKINNIIDLYDPDNTHWSASGYILAGNEITKYTFNKNQ